MSSTSERASPVDVSQVLDPRDLGGGKERRNRRLNVVQIPAIRVAGFFLVLLAVALHNRYILAIETRPSLGVLTLVYGAYCAVSWLLLYLFYGRSPAVDLAEVFLLTDILFWLLAIYASGGDRSWLYVLMFFRVADQTYSTLRRVLVFGHVSVACYALLVVWLAVVERREISWSAEAAKVYLLYSANLYIALTALTAEGMRRKTTAAIRVARDLISELEAKSAELEEARARAEAASIAKSTFLANMSHELRTPLNAILGYAEMVRDEAAARGQHELVPDLEKVKTAGNHLLELINEILDLSKIEAGRMDLDIESLEVAAVVNDAAATARPLCERNGNRLTVICPDAVGAIRTDGTKLRQILLNLLSNAAKFTEKGVVTLDVAREERDGVDRFAFRVKDTGLGMSQEVVSHLFQPFTQADSSTSRRFGGTGLGLTISRRFAQIMGGDIGVESAPGRGSTFTLTLPATIGMFARPRTGARIPRASSPGILPKS